MATETITWPFPPSLVDQVDGTQAYHMGIRFHVVEGTPCRGARWRVPDSVATPPLGTHYVTLWAVTGQTMLAQKAFTPVPGADQDITFDAPVALTAGAQYVIAVYTVHYVYRTAATPEVLSGTGNLVVDEGRLVDSNLGLPVYPSSSQTAWYYLAPITDMIEVTTPVSTTLTSRWYLLGRVVSTLSARWRVLANPIAVSTGYLNAQRRATASFIAQDPTEVVLVPWGRVQTPSGGFSYVAGTPRAPQTVKMILQSNNTPPVVTVAGVERLVDYHLMGPWDMSIAVGDIWNSPDGTVWEVLAFTEGWDYMTKALVGRHIPRGVRP